MLILQDLILICVALAGFDSKYTVVGLKPGESVRFVVKAVNFYGSSSYSLPSDALVVPEVIIASS